LTGLCLGCIIGYKTSNGGKKMGGLVNWKQKDDEAYYSMDKPTIVLTEKEEIKEMPTKPKDRFQYTKKEDTEQLIEICDKIFNKAKGLIYHRHFSYDIFVLPYYGLGYAYIIRDTLKNILKIEFGLKVKFYAETGSPTEVKEEIIDVIIKSARMFDFLCSFYNDKIILTAKNKHYEIILTVVTEQDGNVFIIDKNKLDEYYWREIKMSKNFFYKIKEMPRKKWFTLHGKLLQQQNYVSQKHCVEKKKCGFSFLPSVIKTYTKLQ
jgi:hypothetical protein